ncbi:hypothetical protein [Microbacterium sp. 18062]|uniref:hypothetical protein n=1 Tax=Microbacterium sp. 18062 TaxID=2681410 RepID=UPI001F2DE127|nr:hypothetical protein [Microbacterium sp. 18062]
MSSARSRSDVAPLTVADAAAQIVAASSAVRAAPRILIDGRSGSGKTTLAHEIGRRWPEVQVVALDSLYPGWDGLRAGADRARLDLLVPHAAGRDGLSRVWDWGAQRYAAEHVVHPDRPLLIEGAGVLTARSEPFGDVRVWVDADDDERRRRALARDGATYEPHWERWAQQEDEHLARHDPTARATHRVTLV